MHSFLEWFICFPSLLPSSWGFRARHFWGWNFDMVVGGRCAWLNMEAAPVAKNHLHGYFVSLKEGVLTKSNRECASKVQNGFGCFLMDWIWIWIGPPGRDTPVLVVVVWPISIAYNDLLSSWGIVGYLLELSTVRSPASKLVCLSKIPSRILRQCFHQLELRVLVSSWSWFIVDGTRQPKITLLLFLLLLFSV